MTILSSVPDGADCGALASAQFCGGFAAPAVGRRPEVILLPIDLKGDVCTTIGRTNSVKLMHQGSAESLPERKHRRALPGDLSVGIAALKVRTVDIMFSEASAIDERMKCGSM